MASKKTERRKRQKAGKEKILPRGGQPGIKLTERHKDKIRTSAILNRLENHVLSKKSTMAPHQVSAAVALLKKTIPDLSAVHATDGKDKSHEDWLSDLDGTSEAS